MKRKGLPRGRRKRRKAILRTIADIGEQELKENPDKFENGSFGSYIKIDDRIGCKIIHNLFEVPYDTKDDLYKSDSWKDAVKEYKLLVQAYPSKITPKPYVIIPVMFEGRWHAGIFMQHIPGRYPEVHTDNRGNPIGKMKIVFQKLQAKLRKVGLRHKDLHEFNVLKSGKRTYRVIDFTPDYIARIRLTKKKNVVY